MGTTRFPEQPPCDGQGSPTPPERGVTAGDWPRQPKASPAGHRKWAQGYALLGLVSLLVLGACVGDVLSPDGGWSGVAIGEDELLYVGSMEGQLLALDPLTGECQWAFPGDCNDRGDTNETFDEIYSTPTVMGGLVYVGGYNGKVYALDAETGESVDAPPCTDWRRPEKKTLPDCLVVEGDEDSRGVIGSIVVADGRAAFGAARDSESGRFHALNAGDFTDGCTYPAIGTIGKLWSTPAVADGVAYFGDLEGSLYAVSLEDCTLLWRAELDGAIASTPLVLDGKVYVGAFDRTFYSVDAATGDVTELFQADSWFWSGVATDGRSLFVPSLDGKLYAWDIAQEALAWDFDTDDSILSTPVMVDDRVVVASDSGILYVLDADSGFKEFDIPVRADIKAPLAVQGSVVYLSALDHTIRAYDLDDARRPLFWEYRTK